LNRVLEAKQENKTQNSSHLFAIKGNPPSLTTCHSRRRRTVPPGYPSSPLPSPIILPMPKDASTRQQHRSTSHHHSQQAARQDLASLGVQLISSDDYFLKSDNFRLWLKQYKGKVCLSLHFVRRLSQVAVDTPFFFLVVLSGFDVSSLFSMTPRSRSLNTCCCRHLW
jgi:hypothetical protein